MFLLQIQDLPPEEIEESISLLELLFNGGYMMVPILVLWMVSIYIFVERQRTFQSAAKTPESFKDQIRSLVMAGDIGGAKMLCNQTHTPIARMIEKGIDRIGNPLKNIEVSIENVGKLEIYRLEKNL
ncbi:MAG: MotA/TolQ/ExbB proton channel family protein, partial [Bacteroidota bacterium]